jgi:hypothetical protein
VCFGALSWLLARAVALRFGFCYQAVATPRDGKSFCSPDCQSMHEAEFAERNRRREEVDKCCVAVRGHCSVPQLVVSFI